MDVIELLAVLASGAVLGLTGRAAVDAALARRGPVEVFLDRVLPSPADDRWRFEGGAYDRMQIGPSLTVDRDGDVRVNNVRVTKGLRGRRYWKEIEHHFDRRALDQAVAAIEAPRRSPSTGEG